MRQKMTMMQEKQLSKIYQQKHNTCNVMHKMDLHSHRDKRKEKEKTIPCRPIDENHQ